MLTATPGTNAVTEIGPDFVTRQGATIRMYPRVTNPGDDAGWLRRARTAALVNSGAWWAYLEVDGNYRLVDGKPWLGGSLDSLVELTVDERGVHVTEEPRKPWSLPLAR